MTEVENYVKNIICLQLKKPRNWNWEISTTKSSPNIALPTVQLYNAKGELLVETCDNGSTKRQSWNSCQAGQHGGKRFASEAPLRRSRSDNIEKKLEKYRLSEPRVQVVENQSDFKRNSNIQRCGSDTVALASSTKRRNRSSDTLATLAPKITYRKTPQQYGKNFKTTQEEYYRSRNAQWKNGEQLNRMSDERILDDRYKLKKSRSDVLDIKVKPKFLQPLPEEQFFSPYHRRSRSDDIFQKTRKKYDIKESIKRAENDGYMNFINSHGICRSKSIQDKVKYDGDVEEKSKKRSPAACLATADTVICNNNPSSIKVDTVTKPKRYRLRQSRAGILVISDESFDSAHRKRCHGDLGDCRYDSNDLIVDADLLSSLEDLSSLKSKDRRPSIQRCKSEKTMNSGNCHNSGKAFNVNKHVRQASDPANKEMIYGHLNNPGSIAQTRGSSKAYQDRPMSFRDVNPISQKKSGNNNLFYSKSDVFPFEKLLARERANVNEPKCDNIFSVTVDQNCNYIVDEPLTTPNSESGKPFCRSTSMCSKVNAKCREKLRRRYSDDGSTSSSSNEYRKGPLIRNQKTTKSSDCELLQLVRRLSSSKVEDDRGSKRGSQRKSIKTVQLQEEVEGKVSKGEDIVTQVEKDEDYHVNSVMGANVSRHSTKGLSGRRSQSSGSICNGKGRHQGDGKGSGGSLPSYLDDRGSTSTNYDENDDKEQLNEGERIPPLGDGAPLHWKFSDTQTAQCQDQGYGSERSPEEEYPPPLPEHDLDQCHHHLEAHSCYPFITPESTFTVKLNKGSRGLGLSVTGGIESGGSWPGLVRIKRLFPHQPASACGLLNVGDLLLEANGVPLTGLTNYEALEVLRTATNQVELKVARPPPDVLNCVSPISEVPPPPPTRREPPNSLNFSPSYFGATPEDEYYHGEFEITLTKIQGSLGFTLRKEDDSALGHYVRALVREPALTDGRIKAGDKIIAVNDVEIFPMTHEQAVQFLRKCGDKVKLRLYRDSPQTPVAALSPSETTPRTSFSKKPNLRQEAVDMLNDIAVRKLNPCTQQSARRSQSPASSPRRLRRLNHPSDASQESGTKYLIPEEQFHEGMLKCKQFDEDAFDSLFTIESDDMDRPSRPNSLDLYNPNQTPVAARKPRFNFSLAHNAYELNNLDPEVLDAPNLAYNLGNEESVVAEAECSDSFPKEPASMPHIPVDSSKVFSYKNPAYQSAHPPCVESDGRSSSSASKSSQHTHKDEETDTIKRKKGILKKDSSKLLDKNETKTEVAKMTPMKDEFEILAIELNRGWNSRLGFSLQGAAGVTYVSAVYPDSVAAKDGRIKPGDRIIKVNDEEVEHMSTSEIIDLLRIVRGPVCIFVKRIKSNEDCPKSNAEN